MSKSEAKNTEWKEPSKANVDSDKKYFALIKTSKGVIKAELYPKEAPLSVTNFIELSQKKFYKGLTFHRVVPNFVVQGGDPTATGSGGPGYTLPAEINLTHKEGALAWARLPEADPLGRPVNPEKRSSGSQFYIALAPLPTLDGGYTVFGQTVSGMEAVKQIQRGDVIEDIEIQVE
ncbi:MAG: peptidylprolyl isomerase [bacterium]|nr:peptidylprolyl isomerase [bacterium]